MPFAHFSGPPHRLRERTRKLFLRKSYAVCSSFGFVHRLGFKILNWEPKPDLGPRGGPLGGPRPLDVHCTGPLRPNGQMPHRHAHGGCHDHGALSSVLISGGEIGKRLARRFPILLLKTARARAIKSLRKISGVCAYHAWDDFAPWMGLGKVSTWP